MGVCKFSTEETSTLLKLARACLADAELFDQTVEDMGLSDTALYNLREKLQTALDGHGVIHLETRDGEEALELDGGSSNDYVLTSHPNAWVKVGTKLVNIANRDYEDGKYLVVEVFEGGSDLEQTIADICVRSEDVDLADSGQFECSACRKTFDNDDSVCVDGLLYCPVCAGVPL